MNAFTDDPRQEEDLHAWQILRPLLDDGGYLPWTTGSMRPAGLVAICNEIVHGRRTGIVECGSGVSTVVLARLLRQRAGGHIVALEHDAGWAQFVTEQLAQEQLGAFASVIHAPLEGEPIWYSLEALTDLPAAIDVLIVDGPPADLPGNGLRRAPALAALGPRLTGTAAVFLDDINRPGELAVLAAWQAATDWTFVIDASTGVARGHRPESA